jgi:16S rRNA (adenine1518-N6/adenine1519-N6)-dimethyltransferase
MFPSEFRPQKRKGQNFLIDKNIVCKILRTVSITDRDVVLEIGPGKGILTKELASHAEKVIGVELDKKLYAYLLESLKDLDNTTLINQDILKFDVSQFRQKNKIKSKLTLVGNIPYNITTPILEYIFQNIQLWQNVYLMVQREFARRLIAGPNTKDYSSVSCFTQFHVNPKVMFLVKKTCFRPQPKVDSCFISLEPKGSNYWRNDLCPKDKNLLFKTIQTAFNQRRKIILNSLSTMVNKDKLSKILYILNIDQNVRAENLSLQDFIKIINLCFDYSNSSNII